CFASCRYFLSVDSVLYALKVAFDILFPGQAAEDADPSQLVPADTATLEAVQELCLQHISPARDHLSRGSEVWLCYLSILRAQFRACLNTGAETKAQEKALLSAVKEVALAFRAALSTPLDGMGLLVMELDELCAEFKQKAPKHLVDALVAAEEGDLVREGEAKKGRQTESDTVPVIIALNNSERHHVRQRQRKVSPNRQRIENAAEASRSVQGYMDYIEFEVYNVRHRIQSKIDVLKKGVKKPKKGKLSNEAKAANEAIDKKIKEIGWTAEDRRRVMVVYERAIAKFPADKGLCTSSPGQYQYKLVHILPRAGFAHVRRARLIESVVTRALWPSKCCAARLSPVMAEWVVTQYLAPALKMEVEHGEGQVSPALKGREREEVAAEIVMVGARCYLANFGSAAATSLLQGLIQVALDSQKWAGKECADPTLLLARVIASCQMLVLRDGESASATASRAEKGIQGIFTAISKADDIPKADLAAQSCLSDPTFWLLTVVCDTLKDMAPEEPEDEEESEDG
ncbi:hypothetical protein KIPB_006925, partial [Kipferlia bialata]